MKHFFSAFLLLAYPILSFSQLTKTTLEVNKRFHDFGKIKEDGGKVKAIFSIRNTGPTPLLIYNAEPSCGCTLGDWTRDPIAPGDSGTVTAIFNPKNLVGIIDKTVGVYTNAHFSKVIVLELRGEVIPRDKTMDDVFPYRVGNLMFDKEMIELGDVLHNKKDSAFIVMYNDGQYPIKINNISNLPKGYSIRAEKNTVAPSEEVRLYVTLDGSQLKEFGSFNKTFRLITDDPEYSEKPLFMLGNLKYNFGHLTKKELKKAPKFSIDRKENDFGIQASGSFVNTQFVVTNTGKADLVILSLRAQCHCTDPSIAKTILKKGESTTLSVKFDLLGNAGNFQKPISIYTNDPKKPIIEVVLKAKLY